MTTKPLGSHAAFLQPRLRWRAFVTAIPVIPIIGARKITQFEDNLRSLEITFSPEQVRRLDDVSAVPLGFPNDLLAGVVRGPLFGGLRDRIKA